MYFLLGIGTFIAFAFLYIRYFNTTEFTDALGAYKNYFRTAALIVAVCIVIGAFFNSSYLINLAWLVIAFGLGVLFTTATGQAKVQQGIDAARRVHDDVKGGH